ncbi:hypothetical protein [Ramlibacter sp. PS4R-6]|uniref:hypothetical protein n=1 Tax=Ramlibacter sp. PS4R-6 TaxID=3133438 RepID=UPI00309BF848
MGRWKQWVANPWVLASIGGLLFLAAFQWRYATVSPLLYEFRDDGIITLSHGRNWVDFGFIGINPSGERLEATSAPLQMFLYAAAYALFGAGYAPFVNVQTWACTFALGAILTFFFATRPWFALGVAAASALVLTQAGSFVVWHGSGMENALMHVLLPWTVYLLYRFSVTGQVDLRWAVVPFLASIVRVEAVYHVAPLLAVFCAYWATARGGGEARRFTAVVAVLWIAFNAWRYFYFGAVFPNTAVAQGISVGERLVELVTLSPTYLDQSLTAARVIFSRHGAYLLLLALPLLLLRSRSGPNVLLLALGGTLVLTALFTPFLFGVARLDTSRTTTQLAVAVVIVLIAAAADWQPRRADRYPMLVTAIAVFLIHQVSSSAPYGVCCGLDDFDKTRKSFEQLAQREGIPRPTVANPDLGIVSWHKTMNIVDLGLLGSSIVPRLDADGPAMRRYLLDFAAPDMFEAHGFWSCRYARALGPAFFERYAFAGAPDAKPTISCKGVEAPSGVWIRKDVMRDSASRERALLQDLARKPDVARVAAELQACKASCVYVARSVYRMLPEFRAQGDVPKLRTLFENSPSRDYDLFLIAGAEDPRAWRKALDLLREGAH